MGARVRTSTGKRYIAAPSGARGVPFPSTVDTELPEELASVEAELCTAIDLIADGEDRRAAVLLEKCNARLRLLSAGEHRREALRLWAQSHAIAEDWDLALLKYEQVLSIDAADEDALWQTVQIFLRPKENPETARRLLQDRLLPLRASAEYEDALREAEAALGIEREGGRSPAG